MLSVKPGHNPDSRETRISARQPETSETITVANNLDMLPAGTLPALMRLPVASAYGSMAPNTFTKLVKTGVLPPARNAGGCVCWVRTELDAAFQRLAFHGGVPAPAAMVAEAANEWDMEP